MRSLVVLSLVAAFAASDVLVAPPADRQLEKVDHSKPKRCLVIGKKTGNAAAIKKQAAALVAEDPDQTLRNIYAFVAAVPHVPQRQWLPNHQDFATLVQGFDQRDCARHALLFGSLTRASGIPTVYLKSMRHEWIREFVSSGETGHYSGHVFLEVHVGGKWKLVDAQGMRIWDEYDPDDLELPGGLLAYEKGIDNYAMVHSTRRDLFRQEAQQRFKNFDVAKLRPNGATARPLIRPIHGLTLTTEWKVLTERNPGMRTFNAAAWSEKANNVRGDVLVITSMRGRVALPDADVKAWLPITMKQLTAEFAARKSAVHTRELDDGTLVVLLAAPGWNELMALIWGTDFLSYRCTVPR